jgi:hypothetical protein
MNKLSDLSDTELLGLLALAKFAHICVESIGADYIKGSYFWAVHKSDPIFSKMGENIPGGTGKFDESGNWFVGFCGKAGVAAAQGEHFGELVLLAVMVGGVEKKTLLKIEEIAEIESHIPKTSLKMAVVTVNSKGSRGTSN